MTADDRPRGPHAGWHAEKNSALSQACRMLAGAGSMSLVAYNVDPSFKIEVFERELTETGEILFTCSAYDTMFLTDQSVRADVITTAPEAGRSIISASMHSLGTVTWLRYEGEKRVGLLQLGCVYVHHHTQPIPFAVSEILDKALSLPEVALDTLGARDVAGQLSQEQLHRLIDLACNDEIKSRVVTVTGLRSCSPFAGPVYVIDVCEFGLTLMRTSNEGLTTVHIEFTQPAATLVDLDRQISMLARETAVHNTSRI